MSLFSHQSNEVTLIQVPGAWISCKSILPPADANNENVKEVSALLKPKKYSPDNDGLCIVPVMPAVSPFINETDLKKSEENILLSAPLKGNKSPYSNIISQAYCSGARSCIVPCRKISSDGTISPNDWIIAISDNGTKYIVDFEHGTTFLRLKGCGMWLPTNDLPFPAITLRHDCKTIHAEGIPVSDIRGVCFLNTSCTEMLATSQIEDNLNKVGLFCGNHPLGFWIYKNIQGDPSPLITKTVSIFETLGDRRLESHLFGGLETILSKKYDEAFATHVIELVSPLYENMKEKLPSNKYRTIKKNNNVSKVELLSKINDGSFFNLNDIELNDFSDDKLRSLGFIPTYDIYEKIKDLDKEFVNLVKLYGRLGFEIGRIIGIIHRTGYLWGSYADHDDFLYHVNAHVDNLLVLPKEICLSNKKKLQIIAPVDFDMSFKKENSINFWKKEPVPDPSYVTVPMKAEVAYMANAIGGIYATFKDSSTCFKVRPQPPGTLCNVLWLLRDCAAYEYYQGYQKINSDHCRGNDISIDDIYKLLEEALIFTKENDS